MKNGSILTEALVVLILSFLFFTLVISSIERNLQNQTLLEAGNSELADLLSISNVAASNGKKIPSYLTDRLVTEYSTDGRLYYEYTSKFTGKTYKFKTWDDPD